MAQQHGGERFTRWTHLENGNVINRRLHRIEIQAWDGRVHVLTGDQLPDFIQTCAGHGYKGVHIAQILLNPELAKEAEPSKDKPTATADKPPVWPTARDALNAALGCGMFIMARFFLNALWQAM